MSRVRFLKHIIQQMGICCGCSLKHMEDKIRRMSSEEIEKAKNQQRQHLQKLSVYTFGNYTTDYLSSLYKLLFLLFNQNLYYFPEKSHRNYQQVVAEAKKYFCIKEHCPCIQNRLTTISVFKILLAIIERSSAKLTNLLCFVGKKLASFWSSHIYNKQQIQILYRFLKLCMKNQMWMKLKEVVEKVMKSKISCSIQWRHLDIMRMIFVHGWGTSRQFMIWAINTQKKVKIKDKKQRTLIEQSLVFPQSISNYRKKQFFACAFARIDYRDVIKGCLKIQQHFETKEFWNIKEERGYYHMQDNLHKYIQLYHLRRQFFFYREQAPISELRQVLREDRLEVMMWQHPCDMWDQQYGEYGLGRSMVSGDIRMAIRYLQHSHSNYSKVEFTLRRLHLPYKGLNLLPSSQADKQRTD